MLRAVCVAVCLSILGGCATGYTDASNPLTGLFGGYADRPGPGELVRVDFSGNAYIAHDKVSLYLLYRCAELAQSHQRPYFTMYPSIAHAINDKPLALSQVTSVGGKPLGTAYILYQDEPVPGAISAADILERYGPQVKPGASR